MATKMTGCKIVGEMKEEFQHVLTSEALQFIEKLERNFGTRRRELLQLRDKRQREIDNGKLPGFLPETKHIRNGAWTVASIPNDLQDRRVEITGPVDRKMVINALNSGAKVFMADFEDATSPSWQNMIKGQINLRDAVHRTISLENENGKTYQLGDEVATLKVRPRGWHLEEKNIELDGIRVSASLVDFGLYFFHNAKELIKRGSGPYFYLPKLESHLEARLWNDVFCFAQDELFIPRGTIKATVLIETIMAAFEMDEILYELKEHSAGLNCGRWDYIFSYLKKLRNCESAILPDRAQVTMTVGFMRAYSLLAIKTCHKRNAHAMGGMAAQIPVKNNPEANERAFAKVRADKEREATDGHDGTWVAHPALVKVAMDVFDEHMKTANQVYRKREDVKVTAEDLLEVPDGTITEEGVRTNIDVGIRYIASWLSGRGAAPIHNLMEDAATAEISRAQIWQWIRHPKGILEDGRKLTFTLYEQLKKEEVCKIRQEVGIDKFSSGKYFEAIQVFDDLIKNEQFVDFLTLPSYEKL
ncbi:malate synthase A [Metabacillus sediminilitoris]|uniref:Malate synthase n=1 Tax=Metabacillus sediminilitoris TaxID=2567941 RepID=A0A4V3WFH3_9BACI|nr:malate synthase A [Metabacillus sediminilitoris]QGQ44591.1 malate synthase A [Metabacillus sediminilitoris]THF80218.1 malate synthase A [Metabacillus sediminilitoris]